MKLERVIRREAARWGAFAKKLSSGGGGPDAIHRFRVHTRRCREGLRLLGGDDRVMARFARSLGAARDLEMLCWRLAQPAIRWDTGSVLRHSREARQALREKVIRDLRSGTKRRLENLLLEQISEAEPSANDSVLCRDSLRKAYQRLKKLWKERPKKPDSSYLHPLRRAIRRLRYVAELSTPIAGQRLQRLAKRANRWQDLLGDYHDALIAQRLLERVHERTAPFLAKEFRSLERETAKRFWGKWTRKGWSKLKRKTQKALKRLK